jgi:hypothetical protein
MDLTDRGRGERVRIEGGEEFAERSSETSLDLSDDLFGGDRGNTIAEQGKFSDVVWWQEIVAGRQDLSELDEGWPEFLEGEAETDWSWELWSSRSAAESARNGGSEVIEQPPQSMLGEDAWRRRRRSRVLAGDARTFDAERAIVVLPLSDVPPQNASGYGTFSAV